MPVALQSALARALVLVLAVVATAVAMASGQSANADGAVRALSGTPKVHHWTARDVKRVLRQGRRDFRHRTVLELRAEHRHQRWFKHLSEAQRRRVMHRARLRALRAKRAMATAVRPSTGALRFGSSAPLFAAGASQSALSSAPSGNVAGWGSNFQGELGTWSTDFGGDGKRFDAVYESVPTAPGVTKVTSGGAQVYGDSSVAALYGDGSVTAWGSPNNLAADGLADVLVPDGKPALPTRVPVSDVTDTAAGAWHSLYLTSLGYVYGVGAGGSGELGPNVPQNASCGGLCTMSVIQVPFGDGSQVATQVSAGPQTSYIVDSAGHGWAAGDNDYGQQGNGTTDDPGSPDPVDPHYPTQLPLSGVVEIAAFAQGAIARTSDGSVWWWGGPTGFNSPHRISGLPSASALVSAFKDFSPDGVYIVAADHTLWRVPFTGAPSQVSGVADVQSAAQGEDSISWIDSAGEVWSMLSRTGAGIHANQDGELGNGTLVDSVTPQRAVGIKGAVSVTVTGSGAVVTSADIPLPPGGPLTLREMPGGKNPSEICVKCAQRMRADPVDTATGAFTEDYGDLSIAGRGPSLDLSRTYNSALASQDSAFGYGWSFSYGMHLSVDSGTGAVTVDQEDGSEVVFQTNGSSYTAPERVQASLTHNGDGTWSMVRRARTTFTFDAQGRLISIGDLNGYVTTLAYPSSSTITATDPAGRRFTFSLSGGHVTSVTDSSTPARTVSYGYGSAGDLTSVTDATGGVTTFTYDSAHRLRTTRTPTNQANTTTDPLPVTTNTYDDSGRVTQQTDPLGRRTTFGYTTTSTGSTTVTHSPGGRVTVDRYDSYGLLTSETIASGTSEAATSTYVYDPDTLGVIAACGPDGGCTTRSYDASGNVLSSTDALGRTTSYAYNSLNQQTLEISPLGQRTVRAYDGNGNPISVTRTLVNSDGSTTPSTYTFGYGGTTPVRAGDVTSVTDPRGKTSQLRYDAYGDLVSTTSPPTPENSAGNTTTSTYDTGRGVLASVTTPKGTLSPGSTAYTTTFTYDQANRLRTATDGLWKSTAPTLHRTTYTYDGDGNLASVQTPDGEMSQNTYDAADELLEAKRGDNSSDHYTYTADGDVDQWTDGLGKVTSYSYDRHGNTTATTDPLGRSACSQFDDSDQILASWHTAGACSDAHDRGVGFAYDPAGQLTEVAHEADADLPAARYTYDDDGRPTQMTDSSGVSTWSYDTLDRVSAFQNGAGSTVTYGYDLDGNTTSIKYPGSHTVSRAFDDAGRLASVADWLGNTTTFGYDANSNLVSATLPSATGVVDSYTYDALDNVASIKSAKGATTLASFTYFRDGAERLTTSSTSLTGDSVPVQSYGYTAAGKLNKSGSSSSPSAWTYDAAEQVTSMPGVPVLTYDAAGQMCWSSVTSASGTCASPPSGVTTNQYDASGDRVSTTAPGGTTTTFGYDDESRLVSASSSASGPLASYGFDGDGRRVSKTVGSTTSHWVWDVTANNDLLLNDGTNSYVYGFDDHPLEQVSSSGTVTYLHHDQIGSTRLLTSSSGALVGAATYSPSGVRTAKTGVTTPLGFAGQYTDAETGLIYMRARTYDPATAQFLSVDPALDVTAERYQYASGDPANVTDPSGQISLFDIVCMSLAPCHTLDLISQLIPDDGPDQCPIPKGGLHRAKGNSKGREKGRGDDPAYKYDEEQWQRAVNDAKKANNTKRVAALKRIGKQKGFRDGGKGRGSGANEGR